MPTSKQKQKTVTAMEYPKKVWFLIFVGVLSIAFVLATLFTSLTEVDLDLSSTLPLPLGSPGFATAVESVTNSSRKAVDPDIVVFDDGEVFLADLLSEIAAAERSVTVTNYIFDDGRLTRAVLDALIRRARDGLQVRVLIDGNGGRSTPDELVDALREAGGKVETFRPLGLRSLTRINKRNHIRAIAIDGEIGYTGGLAFDDGWLGDGVGEDEWRDVMFKYKGELARATQDQFNSLWRQTDGEILSGPDFYPLRSTPAERTGSSWFVALFHAPTPDLAADLQDLVWLTFSGASDHIYIATPYMTPAEDILSALMQAARRGVRVEVLMPGPYTDAKLIQAATRARYPDLLGAGVRIFEYQVGRFHEKTITADGHWSMIGSANLDNRSATLNVENVFGIEDPGLAAALEQEFADAKVHAVEITQESFRPNPLKLLYFNLARVFAKQY